MSYLSSPIQLKPLDLFRSTNQESLYHQRRLEKDEGLTRKSQQVFLDMQQHGAVIPPSKNLYYQMKSQLDSVVNFGSTHNQDFVKEQSKIIRTLNKEACSTTAGLKNSLSAQQLYHTQQVRQNLGSGDESARGANGQGDILYPANNYDKLQRNGVRVTLSNKPVRFSKKVYYGQTLPTCGRSRISINGEPTSENQRNQTPDNFKLMPLKKKISPIKTDQEGILRIDTKNSNFNRKSHENFFNDYFGFKDKGKKQINDEMPIKQSIFRKFNIINNSRHNDSFPHNTSTNIMNDLIRVQKEVKTQLNSPNRYFIPNEYDKSTSLLKQNMQTVQALKNQPTTIKMQKIEHQSDKLAYLKRIEQHRVLFASLNGSTPQHQSSKIMRSIDPSKQK